MLPSLAQYPGKAALPPSGAASTRVSQKPMDSDCRLGGAKEKFAGMHNMWRQINRPLARSSITGINASIPFVSRECDAHPIAKRFGTARRLWNCIRRDFFGQGFLVFVSSEKMSCSAAFVVRHFDIQILYRSNIYFCCYGQNFIVSN